MTIRRTDEAQRTQARRTQPLPAAPPKPKAQTDTLRTTGTSNPDAPRSPGDAVSAAKEAARTHIGNAVVDGARRLHSGGFIYPPNLTDRYYFKQGKVGACTDFVNDSYSEMAKSMNRPDLNIADDMDAKGYNRHYSPSMIQYFQKHQTLLSPQAKAQVGDVVFFDWDGNGRADPDHVAIVSKVDAQGRPMELIESRNFNSPTEVTTIRPGDGRFNRIVGYGRLKEATSDNDAANLLPPLGESTASPPAGGAPSLGGSPAGGSNPVLSGGSSGAGGPVRTSGEVRSNSGTPSDYQAFDLSQWLAEFMERFGLNPKEAKKLIDAMKAGKGKEEIAKLAKEMGVPEDKIDALVSELETNKAELVEAAPASEHTKDLLGKVSAEDVERILDERGSPLAGQGLGEFVVQMEKKYGVPAAQFLAQATMESGLGKEGYTQGEHHNIGNLRPGSSWEGPTVSGGSGTFRSYGSWKEGIEDYFKLLSGPIYKDKSLKDQIFTYAPPSENDSSHYYDSVTKLIEQWTR